MKRLVSLAVAAALLTGCGQLGPSTTALRASAQGDKASAQGDKASASAAERRASSPIQHVVIVIQENRTVDNLFQGLPGADTQAYGYDSKGEKIALKSVPLGLKWDIGHSSSAYYSACDGSGSIPGTNCKMDGFDKEGATCIPNCPLAHPEYAYVPRRYTKPLFDLAAQYVFGDRMFASNFDGSSFVSHQYIIAGQAESTIDYPSTGVWGCDGGPSDTIWTITQQRVPDKQISPCFDAQTLGDEMDAKGIGWRYYTSPVGNGAGGAWSAYQAIDHIRFGPDWKKDVVTPQSTFFDDVKNGRLQAVSWVTPTCKNSDHAGCDTNHGPQWVASLVNAVGNSPYWNSTAIFVFWDDYGGWYDHVAPPFVDYDGLGIRVPLLIVSPYAKHGYVSHVQYEHGSILKFVEDQFGLGRLSASDRRAKSPAADCFNFKQKPRAFVPIHTTLGPANFQREPPDPRPVDAG
jgi:phospholipase C